MRIKALFVVGIDLTWNQMILSAFLSRIKTVWFVNEDGYIDESIAKSAQHDPTRPEEDQGWNQESSGRNQMYTAPDNKVINRVEEATKHETSERE